MRISSADKTVSNFRLAKGMSLSVKKIRQKIASFILSFIIFVLALFMIYAVIAGDSSGVFGYKFFVVKTGSMEKTISAGEFILTKEYDDYNKDDIITFISSDSKILGRMNTHRIYLDMGDEYITKGDASEVPDAARVRKKSVIGKVIFHSKILGSIFSFFSKPLNLFIFIFLPITVFALLEIKGGIKKVKETIKEAIYRDKTEVEETKPNDEILDEEVLEKETDTKEASEEIVEKKDVGEEKTGENEEGTD